MKIRSAGSKQPEGMSKERERLIGEVETLKQRLKTLSTYHQELDKKYTETDTKLQDLQDKFDRLTNDMSKTLRDKDNLESDLQTTYDELKMRMHELEVIVNQDELTAEDTLKTTTSNYAKQENILREQVLENERNQKEIHRLMLKQMQMKSEGDRTNFKFDNIKKELSEKDKVIQENYKEIRAYKDDIKKLKQEKENTFKRLTKEKHLTIQAEENFQRLSATLRSAELDILDLKKQLDTEKKTVDKLNREKDVAVKNVTTLEELEKKLTLEIRVYEQTNRKMESSLQEMADEMNEMKRQTKNIEKDRDKCNLESQELAQKVEDYMDELKLKMLEITDYQKRLAEAEAKHRQQLSLFEDMRAERNSYKKALSVAQEEIIESKEKIKHLNLVVDKTREQLAEREAALMKMEFLFGKNEKEKDALKAELLSCKNKISELRHEIDEMKQEEKNLRYTLREADKLISRQKKEIDGVMNERDVIGTQIVRRNDEMSLLNNKLQILTETLTQGEKAYAEKLEEIRMLKLEVKSLKMEIAALQKSTTNLADLRAEVLHLERNLTRERLKVMALEEEIQNPLNIHRWRNLEGTDPDTFEMLTKVQLLQKRILKMSSEMIEKDKKVRETEKMYMALREIVLKQPHPDVVIHLSKARQALREKGKKMKCLVAELNMTMSSEHKFEVDKLKRELNVMKSKYLAQKKKNFKASDTLKENLPKLADDSKKQLSPPVEQITSGPLIPINK